MSTPSDRLDAPFARSRNGARAVQFLLALACAVTATGCGGTRVDAKFRLGEGPIMVFVDDPHERLDYPAARRYIWDDVSQELLRTKSASRVVPIETEESLRRTLLDFPRRSCREIGELTGAEQVLWIEIQDFLAEEMVVDAREAAYVSATVKALNVLEKKERSRVRVWPQSPDGEHVTVSLTAAAVTDAKTKDAIAKELSAKLAVQVARLFHDHELLEFERSP